MIITTSGHRLGRALTDDLICAIEATELHRLLRRMGFHLQPFRIPRGLRRGDLRLRLTWKKCDGGETQIFRLTHRVAVPDRPAS